MSSPRTSAYLDDLIELSSDIEIMEKARGFERARAGEVFEALDNELASAPDTETVEISQSTPMGDDIYDWVPAIKRIYETDKGCVQLLVGRFFNVPTQGNFKSNRHITLALGLPKQPAKRIFTVCEDGFTGTGDHTDIDTTEELATTFLGLRSPA